MSIKSLAHACLKTTDLERTAAFYCGALGMRKLFNFTRKGAVIGFYLKAEDETFLEVFLTGKTEPTGAAQTLSHFCLQTDFLSELHGKLKDAGYTPREIKMGADNSLQFWMTDPNGLDLEFHEYTERSSQRTGQDVEVNW